MNLDYYKDTFNDLLDEHCAISLEENASSKDVKQMLLELDTVQNIYYEKIKVLSTNQKQHEEQLKINAEYQEINEKMNVDLIKIKNEIKRGMVKCKNYEQQIKDPFEITLNDENIYHTKRIKLQVLRKIIGIFVSTKSLRKPIIDGFRYNECQGTIYPFHINKSNKNDKEIKEELWELVSKGSNYNNEFAELLSKKNETFHGSNHF